MVKITNGINIFEVTNGAFKDIYSKQGYKRFEEENLEVEEKGVDLAPEGGKFAKLLEKPISQWTKTEVKDFAEENEVDITGTRNVNEAKAIIKEFINL